MPSARATEFLEAIGSPGFSTVKEHLACYLEKVSQYQLAGLYYEWQYGYNSCLKFADLEAELHKRKEINNG